MPRAATAALPALASLALVLAASPALAEPPPCPQEASGLCGAANGEWPGGASGQHVSRPGWQTDAYLYGENAWRDSEPAAWEEGFDTRDYLARHAGWVRPAERADRALQGVADSTVRGPRLGERLIGGAYEVIRDHAAAGLERPPLGHYYVRAGGAIWVVESATQRVRARLGAAS